MDGSNLSIFYESSGIPAETFNADDGLLGDESIASTDYSSVNPQCLSKRLPGGPADCSIIEKIPKPLLKPL